MTPEKKGRSQFTQEVVDHIKEFEFYSEASSMALRILAEDMT